MKSPPKFVRGAHCSAMRIALQEIEEGCQAQSGGATEQEMETVPPVVDGAVVPTSTRRPHPETKNFRQIRPICSGFVDGAVDLAPKCSGAARKGTVRRRRTQMDTLEKRVERAQTLVTMEEVSAGRHALDGGAVARGTQDTLSQLRRRPRVPREPVPAELMRSDNVFALDHNLFSKNLKCARRGAAGGPSGITAEHVKPILDNNRDTELFCQVDEHLAQGEIPGDVLHVMRMGRMTALQKASGGVRGIVAGDMVRRLVAKQIAQQIRVLVEVATAPFQYVLSTRVNCECIAHALQALLDADPRATILCEDGIWGLPSPKGCGSAPVPSFPTSPWRQRGWIPSPVLSLPRWETTNWLWLGRPCAVSSATPTPARGCMCQCTSASGALPSTVVSAPDGLV